MENKPMINVNYSDISVKKVSFKRADFLEKVNYEVKFEDLISVHDVNTSSFKVRYTRKTKTNVPFSFDIVFELNVEISEEGVEYYHSDITKITNFAEKRKGEIVTNLCLPARASLIIANITKEIGSPFITPATLVKEK